MDLNLSVFQEPRGVMRILHFVFSIFAFSTITGFTGHVYYDCLGHQESDEFSYPFEAVFERQFNHTQPTPKTGVVPVDTTCPINIFLGFASDAKFFVATGVLSMLYSLIIMVVYTKFDESYKRNHKLPLYDFLLTVLFGVLWISSSAAWANGLTGLKHATNPPIPTKKDCDLCKVVSGSFSTLNISVVFGFLNFFLWAADLWFVYKETAWFQGMPPQSVGGV